MSVATPRRWCNYSEPHENFGPLVLPRDVLELNGESGVTRYDTHSMLSLMRTARYICEFLTQPHPDLGRPGAVCPFTAGALERNLIRLTASPVRVNSPEALVKAMDQMRDVFEEMGGDPNDIYKAILVVFPNVPAVDAPMLIETVQKALKPAYIGQGLMIGEFYPQCPAPGLHNAAFRPLRTPDPSLAVRRITVYDAPFMVDDDRYVEGYLNRFGADGIRRLRRVLTQPGCQLSEGRKLAVGAALDGWPTESLSNVRA